MYEKVPDSNYLLNAFNKIKHRGPDNSNLIKINDICIGTHRLSIINTSESGNQPLELEKTYLICNGQIYNYKELSVLHNININNIRSDVDIILHMYNKNIPINEICKQLDGDFSFILYDSIYDKIYVSRDCIGVRPLFYGLNKNNKIIAYASEMKALINLSEILTIKVFPPGMLFDDDNNNFINYIDIYDSNFIVKNTISKLNIKDIQNNIYNLLKKAVIKRIDESDRPVAFLCSGGLDSSIILCIAKEYLDSKNRELHVFSIEFDDDRSNSDDSFYCKRLTEILKVKYTPIKFNINDIKHNLENIIYQVESYDPNTIRASIPMYMLAKYLKENTNYKVFLSGEGADELYCGYNYFNQAKNADDIEAETKRLIKNIHMFDILRADRCFNSQGLEIRVPFLDKIFTKLSLGINGLLRGFVNQTEKHILRESFKNKYPALTMARIIDRQKERMSDGCGFSYVPQLLNYCQELNGSKSTNLESKEICEKEYYKSIFMKYYPFSYDVIIKRDLPKWSIQTDKNANLLVI
jgi:asparagine synthase (glutamine-hydrolysing)